MRGGGWAGFRFQTVRSTWLEHVISQFRVPPHLEKVLSGRRNGTALSFQSTSFYALTEAARSAQDGCSMERSVLANHRDRQTPNHPFLFGSWCKGHAYHPCSDQRSLREGVQDFVCVWLWESSMAVPV